MNVKLKVLASALSLAFAASAAAADEPKKDAAAASPWSWTGHVDLTSAYYLRGITNTYGNNKWVQTVPGGSAYSNRGDASNANSWGDAPESRNPAFQWGFDITHSSGLYLGYWGSQLTYSYKKVGESYDLYRRYNVTPGPGVTTAPLPAQYHNWRYDSEKSIENDFYGGYTGTIGPFGFDVGMTYYYYLQGKYSNAPETKVKLTYGDFALQSQTLLDDTIWGNQADTYWTLTWTKALPYDLTFTANAGYYTYGKEGKFLGSRDTTKAGSPLCNASFASPLNRNAFYFVNGCYSSTKTDATNPSEAKLLDGGFRHLILGISQPIGSTGMTWNLQAIIGGVNRFNIQQDNKVTAGISYAF